ncbi:MAG: hypothetical protein CMF96_12310 [Candidatus Marinimicrobia bacterium]|nr:hypothetical protein [Candidatus Neomarinimicrobiota bacterium]|tara:strand:- start:15712 stop:16551 length:840 start_codon:yes stop_codon:yes gene_type:complete
MNKIRKILPIIGLYSFIFTQFSLVEVDMDLTQIRDSDKQFLKSLPEDIKSYYENVVYNSDSEDLELEIYIKLILENVPRTGNERLITTQLILTNHIDQSYYTKSVSFNYSSGVNLSYSLNFHSLRSILDYYGLLFVGSELDIWSELSGEIYFILADEIANSGQESSFSEGWDSRKQYIEDIIDFKEFRKSKFLFFQALDLIYLEGTDFIDQKKIFTEFYNMSIEIPDYMFESKYVRNFYKAYSEEIAKYFYQFNLINELQEFQFLDTENKDVYKKYLGN